LSIKSSSTSFESKIQEEALINLKLRVLEVVIESVRLHQIVIRIWLVMPLNSLTKDKLQLTSEVISENEKVPGSNFRFDTGIGIKNR
jgi:hypothetical protein